MKIQVDTDNIKLNAENADKIFLSAQGEEELVQLLTLQAEIEEALKEARRILEVTALKINKDFSFIQSDRIKVLYRAYGAKYYVAEGEIPSGDIVTSETKIVNKIDTKAVEKFVKEHGGLPTGITEVERVKSLGFSLK